MTVGKWDAEAWDRQSRRETPTPRDRKPWVYVAVAAFILTAAGVSATQAFDEPQIGVCHATGEGYVFLPVAKEGFEHGHHRHHGADYFVSVGRAGCDTAPAAGNQTAEPEPEMPVNETLGLPDELPVEAPENVAEETVPQNETAVNQTAPEPLPGDVTVVQTADQDDKKVRLTILVRNVGEGNASEVALADDLPDLRRSWSLSGADATSCVLDGAALRCWFGTLAPGESREISLLAYTDRMPCGDGMTNTARATSADDAEARNDASSASILARYC